MVIPVFSFLALLALDDFVAHLFPTLFALTVRRHFGCAQGHLSCRPAGNTWHYSSRTTTSATTVVLPITFVSFLLLLLLLLLANVDEITAGGERKEARRRGGMLFP